MSIFNSKNFGYDPKIFGIKDAHRQVLEEGRVGEERKEKERERRGMRGWEGLCHGCWEDGRP